MKKQGSLLLVLLMLAMLLSGCTTAKKASAPVSGTSSQDSSVNIQLFAKDYLGRTKAEVNALLGGCVDEMYYNGGLIFRFSRSDMWFGFGAAMDGFSEVSDNAACDFVLASIDEAASFDKAFLTKEDLEEKLGLSFDDPSYNEHDGIYDVYAENASVSCTVSCSEDGLIALDEDYITYWKK